jgi:hypothetical protein
MDLRNCDLQGGGAGRERALEMLTGVASEPSPQVEEFRISRVLQDDES